MKLHKRLIKTPAAQRLIVLSLAAYIRLVLWTARRQFDIDPLSQPYMQGEKNAIFAFWHGRMMMLPTICPPRRQMHVMISSHRDGTLISDIIGQFNQRTISGSTSKGGRAAMMELLRLLKSGDNISITPDGPRGPNQIAAPGVAAAAKLAGVPVLPVAFAATRHKRMRSWDRFMLALPFSRIIFCIGAPIMIERTMDDEHARMLIESSLNVVTERADAALL